MIGTQLINGLAIGMVYALIAVGYSLVYSILQLVNFSHGAVYSFGAHMAFLFVSLNFGMFPAILLSIALTGLLGILIDRATLAPLREKKSDNVTMLATTIGISYIIQEGLSVIFGSEIKNFPKIFSFGSVQMGGVVIGSSQIMIMVVSIVLLVALSVVIEGTKIGLATRAVQQNTKAAHLIGINVKHIITFIFFISGVSASIAGSLIAGHYEMVYPTMGAIIGMKAFAATVLGGIGVLHGSIAGGLVIGICESLTVHYLGGAYRDAVAFTFLIIVLIIRPTGLFGKKKIVKV